MTRLRIVLAATTALVGVGFAAALASPATTAATETAATAALASGVDQAALNRAVRPQDDFYAFANGGWLDNTEIPAIYSGYTIYHQVYEEAEEALKAIIEEAGAAHAAKGTDTQKVGDLFATWMDEAAIEKRGLAPLHDDLTLIGTIKDRASLMHAMNVLGREGVETPFDLGVWPDLKNSSQYIVYFSQNGLTLPNRDYYIDEGNENFAKARTALPGFIETMVKFVDPSMTEARAQAVYALEKRIAEHQWSAVENRDDEKTYNPYETKELAKLGGTIDWPATLTDLDLSAQGRFIVSQPSYFEAMDAMVGDVDLATWKDYLTYNLVRSFSSHLPAAVDNANFDFMGKTLNGQAEQRPRWKRGVGLVDDALGEVVGKLYVERHFPPAAKAKMTELVNNVRTVFGQSIDTLDWMGAETKAAAKVKLSKFTAKIGYPDVWRDYSALEVVPGDHFGNVKRVRAFGYDYQIGKLGKPIDKNEWLMTPQTVNAYYDPTKNEIVFPAARLQPPFFQLNADDAINYGAIGGVIGHEMSHGFDDSGSKYDGDGNLKNWWTDEDRKAFEERTKILVAQYNGFEPIKGMHVNGELTLGENIGDLSGVTMAYRAYLLSLGGKEPPVIDGFTGAQRFFIGYAMSRKGKYKDESTISRLASDPHSPLQFRVNGVYRNMPAFYEAFGLKEGDGMWLPENERVSIW